MPSAKVSTKHQIVVQSEARRRLGVQAGDRLTVEIVDDAIVLRRRDASSDQPAPRDREGKGLVPAGPGLDSNVLIYLVAGAAGRGETAGRLVTALVEQGIEMVVASIGLSEILTGPARAGDRAGFEAVAGEPRGMGLGWVGKADSPSRACDSPQTRRSRGRSRWTARPSWRSRSTTGRISGSRSG